MRTIFEVSVNKGVPRYTMPDMKDPQKQIPVEPKFFLSKDAPKVPGLTVEERRDLAASYVTGQDNPWFAKAFVNRVWYTLMGEAFYNPVDDMGPDREAKSPEVLEALADSWAKGGYDIHWLFRTILNTRAYQREIRSTFTQAGRTPFASNCPSRLRSDQILDALAQVLELHRVAGGGGGGRGPMAKAAGKGAGKGAGKAAGKNGGPGLTKDLVATNGAAQKTGRGERAQFSVLFGVDPSTPNDDILGTIPQALFLMNSPQLNRAIRPSAAIPCSARSFPPRPTTGRRSWHSTSASSHAARPPRSSRPASATSTRSATARGVRGHPLEPDQLDRIHHPALK